MWWYVHSICNLNIIISSLCSGSVPWLGEVCHLQVSLLCAVLCQIVSLQYLSRSSLHHLKRGLYSIWCGVNTLGDSGVHKLGDTSAFVNPAGQLLLTRRGKTRMNGIGIVFEFYIAPL